MVKGSRVSCNMPKSMVKNKSKEWQDAKILEKEERGVKEKAQKAQASPRGAEKFLVETVTALRFTALTREVFPESLDDDVDIL
jgi:hypothetical protein